MMRMGLNAWLADIAANFLIIAMILLVLTSQYQRTPDSRLSSVIHFQPHIVQPYGSQDAVTLLRLRLQTPQPIQAYDVSRQGVEVFGPDNSPIVLYVLDHVRYADVTAELSRLGHDWTEFTPPRALTNGAGEWSAEFLALKKVATDQGKFSKSLSALLAAGHGTSASILSDTNATSEATQREKFLGWLRLIKDIASLVFLIFCVGVLYIIRRRYY